MTPSRTFWAPRTWGPVLAGFVLLWWATMVWLVPALIRTVHAGKIPPLSRLMSGSSSRPVEAYLATWEPMGRSGVVIGLTAAVILAIVLLLRRYARTWSGEGGRPAPPPATGLQLLLVGAWIGLLTGLAEAYYFGLRVFYREQESPGVSGISQHAIWMSPVANMILLAAVAAVLVAVRQATRGRLAPRSAIVIMIGIGLFGVTMTTGRLHWIAAAVIALGVAARLGGGIALGAGEVALLARRSMPWLLALIAGLSALVPLAEWRRERQQLAAAGPSPADGPNVLFIILDTERAASTSLHGAARPTTPFLERLAREGVQFERAIAPTGWTLPSHAAMFTGQLAHTLGVGWNARLDETHPTIAEVLTQRGYATAGFVSNTKYLSDLMGLDRGFGVWKDQPVVPGTVIIHSWLTRTLVEWSRKKLGNYQFLRRKTADGVNAEFLHWLDRREPRPFFAFLNYFDPHIPYLPPEPWNVRFSETPPMYAFPHEGFTRNFSAAELAELATAYDSCIAYLDDRLEHLFGVLRERGILENTLVIITSDHGEDLGEGTEVGHGHDLIMPVVHVPLVVVQPGRLPAGVRVPEPVELRHLASTVLSLTGSSPHGVVGSSLEAYWQPRGDSSLGSMAFAHYAQMAAIVADTLNYVQVTGRPARLFNHRADPRNLNDLAEDPAYAGVMANLRERLEGWLAASTP